MSADQPFAPLKTRSSLGTDIAQALKRRIRDGTFKPGDVLPGQRELAVQFGASLASVREAVSVLSAAGLLEARPGKGTMVRSVGDAAPEFDGWLGVLGSGEEAAELVEARRLLEHHSVRAAARRFSNEGVSSNSASSNSGSSNRAASEDATKLYGLLAQMHKAMRERDAAGYAESDIAFHIGIAEIAGNRVIVKLMRSMHTALYQLFREGIRRAFSDERIGAHFEMHRALTQAIVAHDEAAALEVITEMLDGSSPEFIAYLVEDARAAQPDADGGGIVATHALETLKRAYTAAVGPAADLLFEETADRLDVRPPFLSIKHFAPLVQALARTVEDEALRREFLEQAGKINPLKRAPEGNARGQAVGTGLESPQR